jgi:hypothetical protein
MLFKDLGKKLNTADQYKAWGYEVQSIYYGNEGASLLLSDTDCYIIITKLPDPNFNIHPVFIHWWELQIYFYRTFLPSGCLHKLWCTLVHTVDGLYHRVSWLGKWCFCLVYGSVWFKFWLGHKPSWLSFLWFSQLFQANTWIVP